MVFRCKGVEFAREWGHSSREKRSTSLVFWAATTSLQATAGYSDLRNAAISSAESVTGESRSVDEETATAWVQANVGPVVRKYREQNVFKR
ncbi:hypothetical protein HPB48_026128 [Haemaphysalis longicornis]|uniref:Uncharacterized protein n=1 Tax=Haemaphysalis longicornis TaxID=44386 RepID=A0A9J6H0C0_HAELO|nr:hypothetical protein HPB48_026128 [Haemaphysalis longicornis]